MHFVKLWDKLLKSSVLEQEVHVRWFWISMLLEADRDGNVYGTPEALARVANISVMDANEALGILSSPDPNSTTGDEDGRRILPIGANSWYVVNYTKYRGIKDSNQERSDTAERVRRYRNRHRDVTDVTLDVTKCNDIVEGEVEVEVETTKTPRPGKKFQRPSLGDVSAYVLEQGYHVDPQAFLDKNDSIGWVVGKNKAPMKDWKATVRTWEHNWRKDHALSGQDVMTTGPHAGTPIMRGL